MRQLRFTCLVTAALTLVACGTADITGDDLAADPDAFQGELVVRGTPHVTYQCTAVACPNPDEPCNNCVFLFTYGELGDPIIARPAEDWDPVAPALGETPLACFDRSCEEGLQLACHGNDVEAHCSPGVPARITAMHGVLEGRTLHVSSVELADGPLEQRADSIRPGGRGARLFE